MENLKSIIRESGLSTRPEFYSGRGAILDDLNGEHLELIYKGIKEKFGAEAAENFVLMVEGIKVISATAFLKELYQLYRNDWVHKEKSEDESGIELDGSYAQGMATIISAMGTSKRDDSHRIKSWFLIRHREELPESWSPRNPGYKTPF